jgi:hypothetical protein
MKNDNGVDGIYSIYKLNYTIDKKSSNPNDNIFVVDNKNVYIINIQSFLTPYNYENEEYYTYDLRENPRKITNPDLNKRTNKVFTTTEDWKNIPYYPTIKERRDAGALQNARYPHAHNSHNSHNSHNVYTASVKPRATKRPTAPTKASEYTTTARSFLRRSMFFIKVFPFSFVMLFWSKNGKNFRLFSRKCRSHWAYESVYIAGPKNYYHLARTSGQLC